MGALILAPLICFPANAQRAVSPPEPLTIYRPPAEPAVTCLLNAFRFSMHRDMLDASADAGIRLAVAAGLRELDESRAQCVAEGFWVDIRINPGESEELADFGAALLAERITRQCDDLARTQASIARICAADPNKAICSVRGQLRGPDETPACRGN